MNKLDNLLKLYRLQLAEIMESHEQYTAFLKFAVPFYKLNFSDIVLLYAQRPSATMCADFHTWSVRLGLRIRAGAKKTGSGSTISRCKGIIPTTPTPAALPSAVSPELKI